MTGAKHLRCAIVGDMTLPVHCAQILLEGGHTVSVMATDDPETSRSAAQAGIATVVRVRELGESLTRSPVDYLFSINNLSLIEEQ
ncbi:MAG: hypothetical protein JOY58_16895, partial [Solirubrobacterales bacterium]|nr:hypothetical protein [Solirubrobacterales bacterium]